VFVALVVIVIVVSLAYVSAGAAKLSGAKPVRANLVDRLHVPARLVVPLGLLDLAGAAGLVVGLWVRPIGLAAAMHAKPSSSGGTHCLA
jgi:uncharacterized membrane protein YphA (DoxX/SURF4 family)